MAQLPTEQAIGDLSDRLPRRSGVGSWQPGDIARGAQDIARGGDQFGMDLGMLAGQQTRLQDEADMAKAQSAAAVSHIQTAQTLTNTTDPTAVPAIRQGFQDNADAAASLISDPNKRQQFLLSEAPKVAQYQVGADQHQKGLVNNQALADFDTNNNTLINSAVGTDDEGQRSAALGAIKANGISLVNRGIMTPEQWALKAPEIAHNYASARLESEIGRADQTGDTSRLKDLSKLFTFQPGEWGVGGAPAAGPTGPLDQPAQRVAEFAQPIQSASQKYGVSPAFLSKTAYIESAGNPNADNGFAHGLMQFSDGTAKTFGVDPKDPASSIDGAARYAVANKATLTAALGRAPTDAELYLAHQQDGSGAAKLLTNPTVPAGKLVSAAAIRNNGGDPNAPAKQFTDMWINKFNNTPSFTGGATVPDGAQGPAPHAIGDSLAVGIGQVTGASNAVHGASPQQVLDLINGKDVTNNFGTAKGLADADLKGPIVLSSGASNNPNAASLVGAQLAALKSRGVDLSNVTVLGVGNRADFGQVGVNGTLQKFATQYGAKFQPLDPGMLSPDGVHPVAQGYKALVSQIGGGGAASAGNDNSAFIGVPPVGAAGPNPHLIPPQSAWPEGARGVQQNPDGSSSYVMSEGNPVPIPGSRASGAAGAPAPSGTGTLIDGLKPQDRAEFGVKLQNAISTIDRRNGAQNDQYTKAALADMQSRVGLMVGGRAMGPNEAASLQPYASSPIPEVKTAYATMMAIRDNLASYQGKSPADVQADVATKEAAYNAIREKYPTNPNLPMLGDILKASEDYAKSYATEAVKQPLERAVKSGLLPNGLSALDPQDPNIEASLARRVSDAHTASDALNVPIRYLQQSERSTMKDIARQGGQPMVDMATHIVRAGGADAPQIFKEIGLDAPMFQKIGELAAGGGDPEAVKDVASIINAKNDKSASRDLPTFNDKMLKGVTDPFQGVASRFGPDYDARTRAAANMLMSAQASRDGWDPKIDNTNYNDVFVKKAYDLATGATFAPDGTQYGGIADSKARNTFGAANRTIVPNSMKTTDFSNVIGSITDADLKSLPSQPMGKNGAPISAAQIQNGQMEAVPDKDGLFRGKYAVFTDGVRDDNHLVRDASGKPWALDLGQPKLDAALRARNPTSYLAATPPAAAPAPSAGPRPGRYESTPGVVALSGGAETE